MRPRFAPLLWLVATLVPVLALFAITAARGWPGTPIDCSDSCFCEASHPGWARQPANTLSNLVPVALAFVAAAGAVRQPPESSAGAAFARAFPVALALQGAGSMFYHASLVEWGGSLDSMSMFLVMGLFLSVNVARLRGFGASTLLGLWGALAAAGVVLASVEGRAIPLVMFAMLIANLGLEVVMSRRRTTNEGWLRAGLAVFVASNVVWALSVAPGTALCAPTSWLQGHAVWHAGAGVAVFLLGVHFARALEAMERPSESRPTPGTP